MQFGVQPQYSYYYIGWVRGNDANTLASLIQMSTSPSRGTPCLPTDEALAAEHGRYNPMSVREKNNKSRRGSRKSLPRPKSWS